MIARWSDETPRATTTDPRLRHARRAVADMVLPPRRLPQPAPSAVGRGWAWLAAGWMLLVALAYAAATWRGMG